MKIQRKAERRLHHDRAYAAPSSSPVALGLEPLDGPAEILRTDKQIDVAQQPLTRVIVEPVLQERALDGHHWNAGLGQPPRHVAHEPGRSQRGDGAAAGGVSVHYGLLHLGGIERRWLRIKGSATWQRRSKQRGRTSFGFTSCGVRATSSVRG